MSKRITSEEYSRKAIIYYDDNMELIDPDDINSMTYGDVDEYAYDYEILFYNKKLTHFILRNYNHNVCCCDEKLSKVHSYHSRDIYDISDSYKDIVDDVYKLTLYYRKFKCPKCGKIITETFPKLVEDKDKIGIRLKNKIKELYKDGWYDSVRSLSKDFKLVSKSTIHRIVNEK